MDNSDINIKIGIEDSNIDQVIQKIRQKLSNTSFSIKVDPNVGGGSQAGGKGGAGGASNFVTEVREMNVKATTVNIWAQTANMNSGGGTPPVPSQFSGTPSGGGGGQGSTPTGGGGFRGLPLTSMVASGLGLAAAGVTMFGQAEQRELAKRVTAETSKEFFRLQNLRGDFTNLAFEKEKAEGKEKAQGKGTMATSDLLSALAIPLALFGPLGAGLNLGVRALGVGAGIMGGINAAPAIRDVITGQYGEGLDARYQSNLLTTQQNAMMQDPTKRSVVESLMKSRASTTGVYESANFGSLFGKSDFEKVGAEPLGMLLGTMGAGDAQKTFIRNIAEGTRQGLDATQNAKEFRQFVQLLTQAQVTSGIKGNDPKEVQLFNESFSRYFADPKKTSGLEAGLDIKKMIGEMGGETAYQAAFIAQLEKSDLGKKIAKNMGSKEYLKSLSQILQDPDAKEGNVRSGLTKQMSYFSGVPSEEIAKQMGEMILQSRQAFGLGSDPLAAKNVMENKELRKILGPELQEQMAQSLQQSFVSDMYLKRGSYGTPDKNAVLQGLYDPRVNAKSKNDEELRQILEITKGRQFTDRDDTAANSIPERDREEKQGTGKQGFEAAEGAATRFAKALNILSSKLEAMSGETYRAIQAEDRQSVKLGAPQ